jgi:glutamine amidotransferase
VLQRQDPSIPNAENMTAALVFSLVFQGGPTKMCRFIAYIGNPILLSEILFKPKYSLIKQSIKAREGDVALNGDGFGIGWYIPEDQMPGVFVSIQPAWNDRNLLHIAPKIRSGCFFAHVRSASFGAVSQFNSHPFYYKNWLFMHNGNIGGFSTIKRHIRRRLPDEIYDWIQGQTDSEHFFALFLDNLHKSKMHITVENTAKIMKNTIKELLTMQKKYGIDETTYLTAALTDGKSILATRYVSNPNEVAPTLYYSEGSRYECYDNGVCHMHPPDNGNKAVLIASEKLSSYKADWKEVPNNHMLLVDEELMVSLQPIEW